MKNPEKNSWQKISETESLISYERKQDNFNVRIEAYPNKKGRWTIYQVCYDGKKQNHVEKYFAKDKIQTEEIIENLKQGKKPQPLKLKLDFKRAFVEGNSEKWFFTLDNLYQNFFLIQFHEDKTHLDIVLFYRYKLLEKQIISKIIKLLGIEKDNLFSKVYYFQNQTSQNFRKNNLPKVKQINISLDLQNSSDLFK